LYLFVGQTESHVGFVQIAPENRYQMAGLLEPGGRTVLESEDISPIAPVLYPSTEPLPQVDSIIENGEETSIGTPSLAQGQLTVTGHWAFIDRNDNYTSALEFIVQIIRGDNGNHLAWCYTSHNGTYSCGPFTNPGSAGVRSVLRTWTNYNPYGDILTIINPDWGTSTNINNTYGVQTGVTVFPDGVHDIGAWFVINGSTYERAYWTQYDLNRTWRYIWFGTGLSQNPRETSGPATVRWKIDSTDGTYYSYGGHIHLTGADPLSTENSGKVRRDKGTYL
jgi:hypothetical protein